MPEEPTFKAKLASEVTLTQSAASSASRGEDSKMPDESSAELPNSIEAVNQTEIVIGLIVSAGTAVDEVIAALKEKLQEFCYTTKVVHLSRDILESSKGLPQCDIAENDPSDGYERIRTLMHWGNEMRRRSEEYGVLASAAAFEIHKYRQDLAGAGDPDFLPRTAYIISSLKHPDEVHTLRELYPNGFYALGVYSSEESRKAYLQNDPKRKLTPVEAADIVERDKEEKLPFGQHVTDTFHLADFFVNIDTGKTSLKNSLGRILELTFGNSLITPTFGEYAMYLAYAASLHSADLSRQVGAVVTQDHEVIATGSNDTPKFGGGLYWMERHPESGAYYDEANGRDYMRGTDSNKAEIDDLTKQAAEHALKAIESELSDTPAAASLKEVRPKILEALKLGLRNSPIKHLTEFGRAVHAEMDALLCCARTHVSARGATMYCTTYPCHNCTKHIIAAGLKRVVYIEPYTKSKAVKLHSDAMVEGFADCEDKVRFQPFVGVGPRKYLDLFSLTLGDGDRLGRKDSDKISVHKWTPSDATPKVRMVPTSYLQNEETAARSWSKVAEEKIKVKYE